MIERLELGPKSHLEKGTKFRVKDGPYWVTDSGEQIPMRARGVMQFNFAFVRGSCVFIDADSDVDGHVVLHYRGRRKNKLMGDKLVCRPYTIAGRVTGRKRRKPPVKG